jgi:hypothetical protein
LKVLLEHRRDPGNRCCSWLPGSSFSLIGDASRRHVIDVFAAAGVSS